MSRFDKLSHVLWHCQLCVAAHNLQYVHQSIMHSKMSLFNNPGILKLNYCT